MVEQVISGTDNVGKKELDNIFKKYFRGDDYTPRLKSQLHMAYHCRKGERPARVLLMNADSEEAHTLEVTDKNVELRHLQRQLCSFFRKSFPKHAASLEMHGKTYDEFCDRPFLDLEAGARAQAKIKFEQTTDMYWSDPDADQTYQTHNTH